MKKINKTRDVLLWLYIVFIGLFSLDVFGAGYGFFEAILALAIHLVPVYLLLIIWLIARKKEVVGGALFVTLGVYYLYISMGGQIVSRLTVAGPVLLIGLLYMAENWSKRGR